MRIVLTKEETADVIAAHISTIVDKSVLPNEITFDRYLDDVFVTWNSKKEPKDPFM